MRNEVVTMSMSVELKQVYDGVWQELSWLHAKWKTFCQLYGSEEAVALLNECAPTYFAITQGVFWDDVLMGMSRLTDPAATQGKPNLTFDRLRDLIDPVQHPELARRVDQTVTSVKAACGGARQHRNKRIAHNDLQTVLQEPSISLPSVTKKGIDEALASMRDTMSAMEIAFDGSDTAFEHAILPDDGETLLSWLRAARGYRRPRRQRLCGV